MAKQKCLVISYTSIFSLHLSSGLNIKKFISQGWKVVCIARKGRNGDLLLKDGAIVEYVNISSGSSKLKDLRLLLSYIKIFRKYSPTLIHLYNTKPVLIGSIASFFAQCEVKCISTMTGLGRAFDFRTNSSELIKGMLKSAFRFNDIVVFENSEDLNYMVDLGMIERRKTRLVVSSGVDIDKFVPNRYRNNEIPRIFMASRLLWSKGIAEYVEALEIVKEKGYILEAELAGNFGEDSEAVKEKWILEKEEENTFKFLGLIDNIENVLREVDICVVPSYYREGVPRIILEASACGVPVITTDWPGCREPVIDNKTGLIIPPKDAQALADGIMYLLDNPEKREEMGKQARELMETDYSLEAISEQYFDIFNEMGIDI